MRFYTIRTDAGDHRFEKNELTRHSLRTINIARNNRYTAFEPTWSGTFSMPQDSAAIAFFPEALNRMPFDLSITRLVWQECVLETRDIPVNPVGSNATPYDVFVADQAFKFLVSRNIDVNSLKRVGIRFTYIN